MVKNIELKDGFNEILLYTTPNGKVTGEIYLQNETIWLSQQKNADLFGVQRPAITKHLKNIFETGELQEEVVSSKLELTTNEAVISKSPSGIAREGALVLAEKEFEIFHCKR